MRMSILNTATTEQMGYGSFSFFVYTKSTNQYWRYRKSESNSLISFPSLFCASVMSCFNFSFCLPSESFISEFKRKNREGSENGFCSVEGDVSAADVAGADDCTSSGCSESI